MANRVELSPIKKALLEKWLRGGTGVAHTTPAKLATLLEQVRITDETPSLVYLEGAVTAAPLFLIHPVGGDVLSYIFLARALSPNRSIVAVRRVEIHERQEVRFKGIPELAREYMLQLRKRQFAGPYHVAGWSVGGIIALELAHQLEAAGEKVGFVGLIDSQLAPSPPPERVAQFILSVKESETTVLDRLFESLKDNNEPLFDLEAEFAAIPFEDPRDAEAVRFYVRLYWANLVALWHYRPQFKIPRISYFAATKGWNNTERESTIASLSKLCVSPMKVAQVAGDHFSLMQEPFVFTLADLIASEIVRCDNA